MPKSSDLPWGAVGYIDNGCTATLIDSSHIVAAGHCFCEGSEGKWQKDLHFYPRFRPGESLNVAIDRAVVGARTSGYHASDWGIAHLSIPLLNAPPYYKNVSMPIMDFPAMGWGGLEVSSAGYGRDFSKFGAGAPPAGISDKGGNVWWQPALIDRSCRVHRNDNDNLCFDCACVGGNSGSPIIYKLNNNYYLVGVTSGGYGTGFNWRGWWSVPLDYWVGGGVVGAAGSPVTVASRGKENLDIFVVNSLGGIYTTSWGPQTDYVWRGWTSLSDILYFPKDTAISKMQSNPGAIVAAVSRAPDWLDIFAVAINGRIYTASWHTSFQDGWHGWTYLPDIQVVPSSPVSAVSSGKDRLHVFVVGNDGGVYTARWGPETNYEWSKWTRILDLVAKPGSYVSAVSKSPDWVDISVCRNDGAILTASWSSGFTDGWHGWWLIPDPMYTSSIQVEPGSPVTIVSKKTDTLDVFVAAKDGCVYTAAWGPQTNYKWSNWIKLDWYAPEIKSGSHITAVCRGTDKLDIFVIGKDNKIYTCGLDPKFKWGWIAWHVIEDWQQQDTVKFKPGGYIGVTSRSADWLDIFATRTDNGFASTASWHPTFSCQTITGDLGLNGGPSSRRFKDVPRFAQNVAVARTYFWGSYKTLVFATDPDSRSVKMRVRDGFTIDDEFEPFVTLDSLTHPPRQIAAFMKTDDSPQIIVTCDDGKLCTKSKSKEYDKWSDWKTIDVPSGVNKILDIDAAYDSENTNQIYIIGDDGNLYTRSRKDKTPESPWNPWIKLTTSGKYKKVTAIRQSNGLQLVFLVKSDGSLDWMNQYWAQLVNIPWIGWSGLTNFKLPSNIIDIDAAWTVDEGIQVFAVDANGKLFTRTTVSQDASKGWNKWKAWSTHLYAPEAETLQDPPENIISLTASRWQEETGGNIVPVVFATDNQGNVYYTDWGIAEGGISGWRHWKSFYN